MHSHDIETLVREKEPNICQISVWKDGREIYSGEWNGYRKKDCTHIILRPQYDLCQIFTSFL